MTAILRRFAAPAAAATITALVFTGVLWAQRSRGAWPFATAEPAHQAAYAGSDPAAAATSGSPAPDRVAVDVGPADVERLGIRTETVGTAPLAQVVRAVATVVPDESRMSHVHTRVAGWVEQLDVNTTGQVVRAGQPLARIFSQELLASQIEHLAARQKLATAGIASVVVNSGRTRLGVLGMTPEEIGAIEASGEPLRLVTVAAPRDGIVIRRGITVGTSVDPSTELMTIADLSRVWVLAEVAEADVPAVRVGAAATLDFPASGLAPFTGRVEFVYPMLTDRTRTLRVRLGGSNRGGRLRPGLYGTATVEVTRQPAITVPRDALVDTGLQQHVFVVSGDRFEPRVVTVGARLSDRVEIRSGLAVGERIVAAGVFLLDSESRLRATGGAGGHAHGAAPPPDDPVPAANGHAKH